MPQVPRNLDWVRKIDPKNIPHDFGPRLYELLSDLTQNHQIIAQQGNFSLTGTPAAPSAPQSLNIVPHPQGVQFSIAHEADYYQGIQYEIDATANGVTHTYDVGSSRNGVLPVGNLTANYQVRARYPNSNSSSAVLFRDSVTGGSGATALLPSQGAGTTRGGQPPGFGGPYRSQNGAPPVRNS